jgi:hypothetical protein
MADIAAGLDRRIAERVSELRAAYALSLEALAMFHNPTRKPARYAVVVASQPLVRR